MNFIELGELESMSNMLKGLRIALFIRNTIDLQNIESDLSIQFLKEMGFITKKTSHGRTELDATTERTYLEILRRSVLFAHPPPQLACVLGGKVPPPASRPPRLALRPFGD